MTFEEFAAQYPREVKLNDDATVDVRWMMRGDRDATLAFARSLPEDDLMFLRVDLTQAAVIDDWMDNLEAGLSASLVVYDSDNVVGYATVHRNPAPWTRRVGEIRVNVSPNYRGRGLGKHLTAQIFDVARALGLRKLMANMIADQHSAQAAFRRLGFVPEAVLADYAEDRNGQARDLVVMSYNVDGLTDQMDEALRV